MLVCLDIPMSYNVFNVKTDPMGNSVDFLWDPTKNTSIFIKVSWDGSISDRRCEGYPF